MAGSPLNPISLLIEDRSEQEIVAEVQRQGVEAVLGNVFGQIVEAYIPGSAVVRNAVVQFDVSAPDGVHSYQLMFDDEKCAVLKAKGEAAGLTLTLALPVFLRIVGGELDGRQAFASGRVRLSGDVLLAQAMRGWFNRQPAMVIVS